ncbi:MAG: carbohydrate kinase, YjeF related protein, partial [Caulobacteraceae bacterium]|nr:carbohydrate kinase, YjeF related protein [Caulobacteraceae bacterium]
MTATAAPSPREILTVAQMAEADLAAIAAGTPGVVLMERAGRAVADAIEARFAPCPTTVLVGPGNNGGDGYVVARLLQERGWPVRVEALAPARSADAQAAAATWTGAVEPFNPRGTAAELIVDALFGAGLDRPLAPEPARLALALDRAGTPVVAIDVPSGLAGNSGQPLGGVCFRAQLTVTFHRRKPAHALQPGRTLCGEVVVGDIGLGEKRAGQAAAGAAPVTLFENAPELWRARLPWPAV